MPHNDGQRGQDGFIEVQGCRQINDEVRKIAQRPVVCPQEAARERHDQRSPYDSPVFRLLDVGVRADRRLLIAEEEVVGERLRRLLHIRVARQQRQPVLTQTAARYQ